MSAAAARYGLHMKWLIAWDVGVFTILVVLFAPKVLLAHEGSRGIHS